jgi:Leucine-rich repeat (LRR) protein
MGSTGRLFLLALGLAFVLTAFALICPYDVTECECDQNSMVCENLVTIPPLKTGSGVYPITRLRFYGESITSIPNNSLPVNLYNLEFYVDRLTGIDDNAFLGVATTLQSLSISDTRLPSLPRALLKLTNLKVLRLTNTHIDSWDSDIMDHLAKSVNTLGLANVGLSEWPGWLSSFHLLEEVHLDSNLLNSLPDDAFDGFKDTLIILSIASSGLTQVPKALSALSRLNLLDLSDNNILDVNGRPGIEQLNSFPCASTLEKLHILSIGLSVFPNLSNLTQLSTLNLYNNRLTDASSGSLATSLTSLYLDDNQLSSVPAFVSNLSNLYSLSLSFNKITEISFDLFPPSLIDLYLWDNKITKITDATSKLQSSLRSVYLSFNPLSTISNSAFKNLVSLSDLHLYSTSMTRIPLALTSLTNLQTLELSTNPFLSCQCPAEPELVQWFKPYIGKLTNIGHCNHTVDISDYLTNPC